MKNIEFCVTDGINSAIATDKSFAYNAINAMVHFVQGDWGDLCDEDKQLNEEALQHGGRLLGAYNIGKERIYIIVDDTSADEWTATMMFADEY